VRNDYFMLKNIYKQQSGAVKAALHTKLKRAFMCKGRDQCEAA